jgi:hypothetical protein
MRVQPLSSDEYKELLKTNAKDIISQDLIRNIPRRRLVKLDGVPFDLYYLANWFTHMKNKHPLYPNRTIPVSVLRDVKERINTNDVRRPTDNEYERHGKPKKIPRNRLVMVFNKAHDLHTLASRFQRTTTIPGTGKQVPKTLVENIMDRAQRVGWEPPVSENQKRLQEMKKRRMNRTTKRDAVKLMGKLVQQRLGLHSDINKRSMTRVQDIAVRVLTDTSDRAIYNLPALGVCIKLRSPPGLPNRVTQIYIKWLSKKRGRNQSNRGADQPEHSMVLAYPKRYNASYNTFMECPSVPRKDVFQIQTNWTMTNPQGLMYSVGTSRQPTTYKMLTNALVHALGHKVQSQAEIDQSHSPRYTDMDMYNRISLSSSGNSNINVGSYPAQSSLPTNWDTYLGLRGHD